MDKRIKIRIHPFSILTGTNSAVGVYNPSHNDSGNKSILKLVLFRATKYYEKKSLTCIHYSQQNSTVSVKHTKPITLLSAYIILTITFIGNLIIKLMILT
jgi:hypothetical protein